MLKRNIMLLEPGTDEEWTRIGEFLSGRKEFLVQKASRVSEALALVKSGEVDIVLMEYLFPRVKPLGLLAKIKALKPQVEVIFLSRSIEIPEAIKAMKEGAYDFYEFPVNMRLLLAVVEKALEKQELFYEVRELETKVKDRFEMDFIKGRSKPMQHVLSLIKSVAPKNVSVLITGETGTGKELVANAIHLNSPRAAKPFIAVNCGALGRGVLESELFGHEKGSFTGAIAQRIGRFELANGGTLFLDEVGEIPSETQVKLLRVLQERQFERVGGTQTITVDVRVIAATNRDLHEMMSEGLFRKDLYYRLNVVQMELPPLRERRDDIPLLISHFITKLNEEKGYEIKGITKDAMRIMMDYSWPGNVRELENAVESAMALAGGPMIDTKYLPAFLLLSPQPDSETLRVPAAMSLDEMVNEIIRQTLERTGGNKSLAARRLRIGLRTLQRKTKDD